MKSSAAMRRTKHVVARIPVILDKPRELRLSAFALQEFERASGRRVTAGDFLSGPAGYFVLFVWALAVDEDPTVTPEMLSMHIGVDAVAKISSALRRAQQLSRADLKVFLEPGNIGRS